MAKKQVEEEKETFTPGIYRINEHGQIMEEVKAKDETEDIDSVLNMFGPNTQKVSLQRYNEEERKWAHLGRFEPVPDFIDFVKDRFGGGDYRIMLFDKTGQFLKGGMKTFSIDKIFTPKKSDAPSTSLVPTVVTPSSELGEIKQLLTKVLETFLATPKENPLEVALKIVNAMKPDAPQSTSMTEAINLFKEGLAMGQGMNGDLGYLPVIEKFAPPVLSLLEKAAGNVGNGQKVLDKAKEVNGGTVKPMTMFDQLLKFVPQIIPAAKAGQSQEEVVDGILDRVPPMFYDTIYQEVTKPDFLTRVIAAVPETKEHEAWFVTFVEKFKEMLSPENENETESVDEGEEETLV